MQSANGYYKYNSVYNGKTLSEYVELVYEKMREHYKWTVPKLIVGKFGYENLINCIGRVFIECDGYSVLSDIAESCHNGWRDNYTYWRDNKPYLTNDFYIKPYKPFGDKKNELYASTDYKDLDAKGKESSDFIASVIKEFL